MQKNYPERVNMRLKNFDYAHNGCYFVTFCVKDRHCMLGRIENGVMSLSQFGFIIQNEIIKTGKIRPNTVVDRFVIMPNHVHLILRTVGANYVRAQGPNDDNDEHEENDSSIEKIVNECNSTLQSPSQTVGAVVRGIKSAASREIGFSLFQRGYYDEIIRSHQTYQNMIRYIDENPVKWRDDTYFESVDNNERIL